MKNYTFIIAAFLLLFSSCKDTSEKEKVFSYEFEPTWESLKKNEIPEWLMDAKFGIYAHWGAYSVPAYKSEWYGKHMYNMESDYYEHHVKHWGDPSEFGYKEFIPMFKAEKYEPAEWAELVKSSGARYAGFALVHHDGFCLWDSKHTRWNSMNMGPKRDLYGDFVKELRKQDLKVIATFHHIRTFNWYLPWVRHFWQEPDLEKRNEYLGKDWDIFDPEYGDLYWNEEVGRKVEDFILEKRNKVAEVVDNYKPDIIWFDGGAFQDEASSLEVRKMLANYYNKQNEWQKPLVVLNKLPGSMQFNFPYEFGILSFEEGRDRAASERRPWIDDMKISDIGWGYVKGQRYKTANEIIDGLIDRVSRGGGLLLNLSPKPDGTIPEEQKNVLHEIGEWLKINGEAIFDTRPWKVHAEGPTDKFFTEGRHPKWNFEDKCDSEDIRFTAKGDDVIYVMALDWPADMKLNVKTINSRNNLLDEGIKKVSLLGSKKKVEWSTGNDGMEIILPEMVNEIAVVLKFELK